MTSNHKISGYQTDKYTLSYHFRATSFLIDYLSAASHRNIEFLNKFSEKDLLNLIAPLDKREIQRENEYILQIVTMWHDYIDLMKAIDKLLGGISEICRLVSLHGGDLLEFLGHLKGAAKSIAKSNKNLNEIDQKYLVYLDKNAIKGYDEFIHAWKLGPNRAKIIDRNENIEEIIEFGEIKELVKYIESISIPFNKSFYEVFFNHTIEAIESAYHLSMKVATEQNSEANLNRTPQKKRSDSEVHRSDTVIRARASKELSMKFDNAVKKLGLQKREAMEEAILDWLQKHEI